MKENEELNSLKDLEKKLKSIKGFENFDLDAFYKDLEVYNYSANHFLEKIEGLQEDAKEILTQLYAEKNDVWMRRRDDILKKYDGPLSRFSTN